ncbi:MAG: hypothetical protein FJ388_11475 [Verrucomicrobia bacterium]|nr:hypothetical protein [Verrucomicrobiota bacterium]
MNASALLVANYVLMVSSMHPSFLALNDEQVRALNATPFDGVAVDVIGPYDGSPLPGEGALLKHCEHVRGVSTKAIWPRVYGNRTIELSPKIKALNASRVPAYFETIQGMDICDTAGALGDFYRLCHASLRMARTLGAPGIVFDMEVYNHADGYRVQWIAERQRKTAAEVIARLKAIGARVADITGEEFPGAILWSLFTTLNRPNEHREPSGNYYTAPAYVFLGLLERAVEKRIPLRLVSGGEWGGYCYKSVEAMRERFATRNAGFQPWLAKYPDHLALGATITVWGDARNNRGWVLKDATPDTPWRTTRDFEPLLAEMFRTYRYVWFYVPSVTDYKPLDAAGSREINRQIAEMLGRTRQGAR